MDGRFPVWAQRPDRVMTDRAWREHEDEAHAEDLANECRKLGDIADALSMIADRSADKLRHCEAHPAQIAALAEIARALLVTTREAIGPGSPLGERMFRNVVGGV